MLLIARPIEVTDRAEGRVVFESERDLRSHAVADLRGGRELESVLRVLTLDRSLQDRIDRHVPPAPLLVDDRTELQRPRVGRELPLLITDLCRKAQADGELPALRRARPRPDVIADPFPRAVRLDAREHVEAG